MQADFTMLLTSAAVFLRLYISSLPVLIQEILSPHIQCSSRAFHGRKAGGGEGRRRIIGHIVIELLICSFINPLLPLSNFLRCNSLYIIFDCLCFLSSFLGALNADTKKILHIFEESSQEFVGIPSGECYVEGAKKIGHENISSSTVSKTLFLDPNNGDIFCKSLRAQRLKRHSDQALKTWTMHTQFDKVTNIPNCTKKQISREILIGKPPE
jgi:hypothetical protein